MSTFLWPGIGTVEAIAPGVYLDSAGNVHFHVTEILTALESENTPENRSMVAKALVEEARRTVAQTQEVGSRE